MGTTKFIKMKNSESGSKSKKNIKSEGSVKTKKAKINNFIPGEVEIREKANEIYLRRIECGEDGTAETDWLEAEKYFSNLED